jgi:deoxyribose-phosphate aldolase
MSIAHLIDHTVLKPTTTGADIEKLCAEASEYGFATVCVPPYFVAAAKGFLNISKGVGVATVIGFPFGYSAMSAKAAEVQQALADGADELDMVINLAALKAGDEAYLKKEIDIITALTHKSGKTLKLIIESGILTNEEIIQCCELYQNYPVQFLKTSTGYAEKGATVEAVQLMRQHLPSSIQIKASGGIKTLAFAQQLVTAGATRLGCSASVAIVKDEKTTDAAY